MGDVARLLPLRAAAGGWGKERTQKTSERGTTRTVRDPGPCPPPSASFSVCEQPRRSAPLSLSLGPTSGPERGPRGVGHLASPTRGHTPTHTPSPSSAASAPSPRVGNACAGLAPLRAPAVAARSRGRGGPVGGWRGGTAATGA